MEIEIGFQFQEGSLLGDVMSVNLFFVSLLLSKDEKEFRAKAQRKAEYRKGVEAFFAHFGFLFAPLRETSLLFDADDLSREERNHYLVMPCD
ncbi:MAG TPA: hypothetical protein VGC91_05575 [Pyrinomonadaceae bacterium]